MTTLRKAAEKALEALEAHADIGIKANRAIDALRAALAEPPRKSACVYPQCVSTTRTQCDAWASGACDRET